MIKSEDDQFDPLDTYSGRTLFLAISAKMILMLGAIIYVCFQFNQDPSRVYDWRSYLPILAAFLIGIVLIRFALKVITYQAKNAEPTPKQEESSND